MDVDLPADLGRLENGHGLHHQRTGDAHLIAQLLHPLRVGDLPEDRVVLVEGVPDLVDGLPLRDCQPTVLPGLGLEEVAHLAGRVEEVFAEAVAALARLPVEDGDLLGRGLEAVNQPVDLRHTRLASLGGDELGDQGVTVLRSIQAACLICAAFINLIICEECSFAQIINRPHKTFGVVLKPLMVFW